MGEGSQPEAVLRAITALPVGIAVVRDGVYTYVNDAFCELAGHCRDALLQRPAFSIVAEEERASVVARHLARQQGAPVPPQYELTAIAADGSRRRIELEPKVLSPQETVLVVRALGTRAQDRDLLTALGALQTRVQRQRSVREVVEAAVTGLRQLGFDAVVGQLVGEDCIQLAQAMHPDIEPLFNAIFTETPRGKAVPLSRLPLTRSALELGQSFLNDDASDALARLAKAAGLDPQEVAARRERSRPRHATISPLSIRGRAWGVLIVLADGLRSNDSAALALFASQVASSIEVAQAIEGLEVIHQIALFGAELSKQELVDQLLPLVCKATQSDAASIYLLSADEGFLDLAGLTMDEDFARMFPRLPLAGTLTGRTLTENRARAVSLGDLPLPIRAAADERGFKESAIVPLGVNGRPVGTLHLTRRFPQRYLEEELRSAELLSTQVALQLERARLYGESRRRVQDLSLINELGAAISRHLKLDELFSVAVHHVSRIVDVKNTFLMLLDASGETLQMVATNAQDDGVLRIALPVRGRSAASETVRTMEPVVIPDTATDDRTAKGLAGKFGHRALVATPIVSEGKAIGALVLGETRGPRRFAADEVHRAVEVANQLGTAIVNARLYEDLQRSYRELTLTQQELVKRERLAALGELSALVAHEVRNPLGVIFNSVSSLKRLPTGEGPARQLLKVVEEEADRLNRMVNDLLDFAGPSSARVRPEPLEIVLSGALEAAASTVPSDHVKLQLSVSQALPPVPIDAQMLRQAVVNLVVNAIQAMPTGGVVSIDATREERGGGAMARLEIRDNGPGMPEGVAARAFEPFFTTKAAGTGLGLAVVKRIAEAHGGEVAIASTPGVGSTFTLRLPLLVDA